MCVRPGSLLPRFNSSGQELILLWYIYQLDALRQSVQMGISSREFAPDAIMVAFTFITFALDLLQRLICSLVQRLLFPPNLVIGLKFALSRLSP